MAAGDKIPIKWEKADFKWDIAPPSEDYKVGFKASSFPYTWDDVALIKSIVGAIDEMPWTKFGDEEKKCLVKKPTKKPNETAILNKTLYSK